MIKVHFERVTVYPVKIHLVYFTIDDKIRHFVGTVVHLHNGSWNFIAHNAQGCVMSLEDSLNSTIMTTIKNMIGDSIEVDVVRDMR